MSYNTLGEGSSSGSARLPSETRKGKYPANRYTQEEAPLIVSSSFFSSPPYGAIAPHDTQPPSRPSQKTCTYIIILATTCILSLLFILLWLAPTFAERIVKQDVQFTFQQASILNVSQHKVITMHVVGSIEVDSNIFHLQQKFNNIFGTIGIYQTELNVHYQKALDSFSMGTIDLPALDLNHGSAVTDFDFVTDFLINDTDALMEFCKDAVVAETVLWRVVGPLSVSLGWLPWTSNVILDKTVAIEGTHKIKRIYILKILGV